MRLFGGAVGPDFTFVDGNYRPHRISAVKERLKGEGACRINLQALSLD